MERVQVRGCTTLLDSSDAAVTKAVEMNSQTVQDWLQILGMLGIIASLIFVGVQVNQTQRIGEGEAATNYQQSLIAGRELLVNNADVWARGCKGEEMSVSDRVKFAQMYRTYTQVTFFGWLAARNGILEVDGAEAINAFAANLHRYPGFARMGNAWVGWAEEGLANESEVVTVFLSALRARLAELREIEPDPQFDVMLCGM